MNGVIQSVVYFNYFTLLHLRPDFLYPLVDEAGEHLALRNWKLPVPVA